MPKLHRLQPCTLKHARTLRQPLALPEQLLWSRLRNRQLGEFKFRRQHPIGKYIVDLCCIEAKLVIELDGESHGEQVEYDKKRTQEIAECGYREIRFTNRYVVNSLDDAWEVILQSCLANVSPSPHPSLRGRGTLSA